MSETDSAEYKIADPAEMMVEHQPPLHIHPGIFIRDVLLPQYGLKVAPLARLIGVARPNLHHVLQGERDVSRELAYRLGALMDDAVADLLIGYQLAWDKQQEADRREALKREITRLPKPECMDDA
ncbi:transcriptional regulator [Novosphingobium sp.]|uniref:helix-turn-helix transcriptional regulator n=1 Tax=Novosphingobium sp. TaxID=1874826 RepID=UPI0038BD6C90